MFTIEYRLSNGVQVFLGQPFEDEQGNKYPSNWLNLMSATEHLKVGITQLKVPVEEDVLPEAPTLPVVTYKELRAAAYPLLEEQADMAYWDRQNGTTTLDNAITAVKTKYPKS